MTKEEDKRRKINSARLAGLQAAIAAAICLLPGEGLDRIFALSALLAAAGTGIFLLPRYPRHATWLLGTAFLGTLGCLFHRFSGNPYPAAILLAAGSASLALRFSRHWLLVFLSLACGLLAISSGDIIHRSFSILLIFSVAAFACLYNRRVQRPEKQLPTPTPEKVEKIAADFRFLCLGRVAAGVVHDLSNPLSCVCLGLEMIDGQGRDKLSRQLAREARCSADRMAGLIGVIKEHINGQSQRAWFCANDEIRQILKILSFQARKNGVSVSFCPNTQVSLYGHRIKFGQIVCNLVANALEATKELADRRVFVNLWTNNKDVYLSVRDTGPGLRAARAKNQEIKTAEGHLGLGLDIVKRIVESDFKGSLTIEELEQGLRLIIRLPRPEENGDGRH